MKLLDVIWTTDINILYIECCSGNRFLAVSNCSLVRCPYCFNHEYWHDFSPKSKGEIWGDAFKVMENCVLPNKNPLPRVRTRG